MHLSIIINSIVCVYLGRCRRRGLCACQHYQHCEYEGRVGQLAIGAALLVPVAFVVSGVGAWLADARGATQLAVGLIALPWAYGLAFVAAMLVSFKQ